MVARRVAKKLSPTCRALYVDKKREKKKTYREL